MKKMNIQKDVSLKSLNTYFIGGKTRFFFEATNKGDLINVLNYAFENNLKYFILGGGSNILFGDNDFEGLVIKNSAKNLDGEFFGSGLGLGEFILQVLKTKKYSQELEKLFGIPGTLGGAVRGNAGANGFEVSNFIKKVEIWHNGEIKKIKKEECEFGYRKSIFKKNNAVILSVSFDFKEQENLDFQNIIQEAYNIAKKRAEKNPKGFSCGSFFQNPENLSAGKLIEECGLRGYEFGQAKISEQHGNWIINTSHASTKDILECAQKAQKEVYKKFEIILQPEVKLVNCEINRFSDV